MAAFVLTTLLTDSDPESKLHALLTLAAVARQVKPTLIPTSTPELLLLSTLLVDTHALVPVTVWSNRPRGLVFAAETRVAATVTLTAPVVAALVATTLLGDTELMSKLTARVRLALGRPAETIAVTPESAPAAARPRTLLDDTHAVVAALVA